MNLQLSNVLSIISFCVFTIGSLVSIEANADAWIQSGTSISNNSNVGIGITTPSARLDVQQTTDTLTVAKVLRTTTTGGAKGFGFSAIVGQNGPYASVAIPTNVKAGVAGVGVACGAGCLQNAGYLTPGIFGFVPAGGHGSAAVAGLFKRGDSNQAVIFGGNYTDGLGNYPMVVRDVVANATHFIIDSRGYVGLGTAIPNAVLEAVATTTAGAASLATFANTSEATGSSNTGDALVRIGITGEVTRPYLNLNVRRRGAGSYAEIQTTAGTTTALPVLALQPAGGKVGIGNVAPSYPLDVTGTVRVGQLIYNSDSRLKTDITPIESPVEKLLLLHGVTYSWNELAHEKGITGTEKQIGLIAQDVEKSFPEAVKTGKDGYKSVNYPSLVAPLVAAFNELYNRWMQQSSAQDQAIEQLRAQNAELRKRLEVLESKVH